MEASQGSSKPPRPRQWRQMVRDIEAGRANEVTAGEAYRLVLRLLKEQEQHFGEEIWRHLAPARTRVLRGGREQLRGEIAIVEALLRRITTTS